MEVALVIIFCTFVVARWYIAMAVWLDERTVHGDKQTNVTSRVNHVTQSV